ncbi:MAG: hypothetical protein IJJ45_03255 [Clostridia bacterium]|nr:hypothetical protein [Clostridia bacterium]
MLRRITPALVILFCFLMDTALIPAVYRGVYVVPLTIIAVLSIGMILGRMSGLLFGTFGGLLMDITSGTLGMMTFFFMWSGFMIGLIVYAPGERILASRRKRRRRVIWRASWVFSLYALGEVALFLIQYFNTASFEFIYLFNILVRAAICTALTMLLNPLMQRLLVGRGNDRATPRNREVKSF